MKILDGKNIYIIGTGARKVVQLPKLIRELTEAGANVYTILSDMGRELCGSGISDFEMPGNTLVEGYSREGKKLPLEDLVLIAPCTFNTLNKISLGIADNYQTTIVASTIGEKRRLVIAPAMNRSFWNHPQTHDSLSKMQSWGCSIIYPEISLENVTMAPIEKVSDTVFSNLAKVRYESERIDTDSNYVKLVEENYSEFRKVGESMINLDLTKGVAGCMVKKVSGGYLVSSTGSQIGSISKEELTLVTGVRENKILWQGQKMPSSETPLFLEIYSAFPDAQAIIHGHCPRITYDNKMQGLYASKEYVRYGIFGESNKIEEILNKNNGFAILRLHGEISLGESLWDAFLKLKSRLEEAHAK